MKKMLILFILSIVVLSCGKKEEEVYFITNKKIESKEELEKIKDEIRKEKEKKSEEMTVNEMIDFSNIPERYIETMLKLKNDTQHKMRVYNYFLRDYGYFLDKNIFYRSYSKVFIDEKDNFIKADKIKIEEFLSKISKVDLKEKEKVNESIKNAEKFVNIEPKYEKYDELIPKLIEEIRNEEQITEEIKNYYKTEEYKKDDFKKGNELNQKYLEILKNLEEKHRKIGKYNSELKFVYVKDKIMRYKAEQLYFLAEIEKLNTLNEMFLFKIYDWYSLSKKNTEIIKNQSQHIEDLKIIQREIKKVILSVKEKENSSEFKIAINENLYEKIMKKVEENDKLSEKIIEKLDKKDYTVFRDEGIDYRNNYVFIEKSILSQEFIKIKEK